MFRPCGDTIIIEKFKEESNNIIIPDTAPTDQDIYIVKAVGKGYVTENGTVIAPEVIVGDKVVVLGKILEINTGKHNFLLARAQDAVAYERE